MNGWGDRFTVAGGCRSDGARARDRGKGEGEMTRSDCVFQGGFITLVWVHY